MEPDPAVHFWEVRQPPTRREPPHRHEGGRARKCGGSRWRGRRNNRSRSRQRSAMPSAHEHRLGRKHLGGLSLVELHPGNCARRAVVRYGPNDAPEVPEHPSPLTHAARQSRGATFIFERPFFWSAASVRGPIIRGFPGGGHFQRVSGSGSHPRPLIRTSRRRRPTTRSSPIAHGVLTCTCCPPDVRARSVRPLSNVSTPSTARSDPRGRTSGAAAHSRSNVLGGPHHGPHGPHGRVTAHDGGTASAP
jgi:hypothetical protein